MSIFFIESTAFIEEKKWKNTRGYKKRKKKKRKGKKKQAFTHEFSTK